MKTKHSAPLELYLYLRNKVKPKYGYYIKYNNMNILSFSPELFFETKNNKIYTSPMKGTRKRSNNIEQDNKLKFELKNKFISFEWPLSTNLSSIGVNPVIIVGSPPDKLIPRN